MGTLAAKLTFHWLPFELYGLFEPQVFQLLFRGEVYLTRHGLAFQYLLGYASYMYTNSNKQQTNKSRGVASVFSREGSYLRAPPPAVTCSEGRKMKPGMACVCVCVYVCDMCVICGYVLACVCK